MILEKKSERRRKRSELSKDPITQEETRYEHASQQAVQGDHSSAHHTVTNGGNGASPKHAPKSKGDGAFPKHTNDDMPPSPVDRVKSGDQQPLQQTQSNGNYISYHQQPQQQSFGVGKH